MLSRGTKLEIETVAETLEEHPPLSVFRHSPMMFCLNLKIFRNFETKILDDTHRGKSTLK